MKRIFLLLLVALIPALGMAEERYADIKFKETVHNFGTFAEGSKVTCSFTYVNKGNIPLIINQTMTSCGCTVSTFTKTPVLPDKEGTITVTYDGRGKFPGHFRKTITVHSNAKTPLVRIYIEGDMTSDNKK